MYFPGPPGKASTAVDPTRARPMEVPEDNHVYEERGGGEGV